MVNESFQTREAARLNERVTELDRFAEERDRWRAKNAAYYRNVERLVKFVVPEGADVLEIGSSTGDLLAALKPRRGLGVDVSPRMVEHAHAKHPGLDFVVADAETLDAPELANRTFDYIVVSVTGMLSDVWSAFRALRRVCHPLTRVVVTYYNLWEPLLRMGERIGQRMPMPQQNWLGMQDLTNLLELNHFEIIRSGTAQLAPAVVSLVAPFANKYLAQALGLRHLALTKYFVCKLAAGGGPIPRRDYTCSVIVPTRNEAATSTTSVARTPGDRAAATELIFVEGQLDRRHRAAIQRTMRRHDGPLKLRSFQQTRKGQGRRRAARASRTPPATSS